MTNLTVHQPPRTDHIHSSVPLETAFDFLNTLELENDALVERLTSLEVAADWLAQNHVVADPAWITELGPSAKAGSAVLDRLRTTRTALRDVAHSVAHGDRPPRSAIDEVNRALGARERLELVAVDDGVRLG